MLQLVRAALSSAVGQTQASIQPPQEPILLTPAACFITLTIDTTLRGCIGSLQAHRPLYIDLIENSRAAALKDPRFPPLQPHELDSLTLQISILSTPEPLSFRSEADLISQLRPHIDGLILTEQGHKGTFLPSVWGQLPNREQFLNRLKQKAGLPPHYWSEGLTIERYTTESFAAPFIPSDDHH